MKTLRRICAAAMLSLVLTASANAGDIHTTITPPPGGTSATTEGDIHTGITGDMHTGVPGEISTGGAVTDAALALIQSVLSLF